jgi:hypothetical protein
VPCALTCMRATVPCSLTFDAQAPSKLSLSLFHFSSTSRSLIHQGRAEQSSWRCLLLPPPAILASLRTGLATLLSHHAGALADCLLRGQLPVQQPRVAKHRHGRATVGLRAAAAAPGRGSNVTTVSYPSTMAENAVSPRTRHCSGPP